MAVVSGEKGVRTAGIIIAFFTPEGLGSERLRDGERALMLTSLSSLTCLQRLALGKVSRFAYPDSRVR